MRMMEPVQVRRDLESYTLSCRHFGTNCVGPQSWSGYILLADTDPEFSMVAPCFWPTIGSGPPEEQAGIREILYN
ncbi:hypothetical protein J2857_004427 [Neorhizobium galegae]|nr:hypothetical protein [Neorhizobium galegae]